MLEYCKTYIGIPSAVTIYDEKLENSIAFAKVQLEVAGVSQDETNPVVKEFIATYARYTLDDEKSKVFIDSERQRMRELLELLTFGGIK